MRVELLQTMEWSKLKWDLSFEKIITLSSLLPEVGKTYPVVFSSNEDYAKSGKSFLLWLPPHSELNGWYDKRPTEILHSFVLEGFLIHKESLSFDFTVISSKRLCDFFNRVDIDTKSPLSYVGQPDGTSILQWQHARGLIKSKVGKYLYISGSECESTLDAIVSVENNRMCLHYSATLHSPAKYESFVTNYYLNADECRVFNKILDNAEEINDNSIYEYNENQILGAEYW